MRMKKKVFVLLGQFCEDTWVEGVYSARAEAMKRLERVAKREGKLLQEGVCDTYDVGRDWYKIKEYEIDKV